jgi:hypothetical protein
MDPQHWFGEEPVPMLVPDKHFLCTGAFLYVRYNFLLISDKFCESLNGRKEGKRCVLSAVSLRTTAPPTSGSYGPLKLLYIKLPMDLHTFLSSNGTRFARCHFRAQKVTCPRNGSARVLNIYFCSGRRLLLSMGCTLTAPASDPGSDEEN